MLEERVATFRPVPADDLVAGAAGFVGKTATFQNIGIHDETGEPMWSALDGELRSAPFVWVFERDLQFA
jgi:hypothetical protein